MKRIFDIIVCLPAVILLSPVFVVIAIAIRLCSHDLPFRLTLPLVLRYEFTPEVSWVNTKEAACKSANLAFGGIGATHEGGHAHFLRRSSCDSPVCLSALRRPANQRLVSIGRTGQSHFLTPDIRLSYRETV